LISFREIREATREAASPEEFARVIKDVTVRHEDQASRLTFGMREWRKLRRDQGEAEEDISAFVDGFLDRVFLSWIGMSTLSAHYLALCNGQPYGVVDKTCSPYGVAVQAAKVVENLGKDTLARPPKVEVRFHGIESSSTLPLIPTYLFYILQELLKNSVRAAGDRHEVELASHEEASTEAMEDPAPVIVRVSSDKDQVALQIFDRGGGIPFERQPHVWSYMYSTAKGSRVCTETGRLLEETAEPSPLAGFGVGLPLSRLYAEYLGGSLHLMSMPNFGTYAYLFLQTSSQKEEALPTYVNWLRKRRLRDRLADLERRKADAAAIEEYFEAARLKALAMEVRAELANLDRNP
jgi:pyruvate dehydrogenase kinase 2/3/4